MSLLIPLAILAFLISPFAISGYRRAWRGPAVLLVFLALYTAFVCLQPIPADMQESDKLGAAAWRAILLFVLFGSVFALAVGLAFSGRRGR